MNGFNLSDITDAKFGNVQVSELYFGSTKIWPLNHDYSQDYLTFKALESGNFTWAGTNNNSIYYSIDDGSTWTQLTSGSSTPTINANAKILFKATGLSTSSSTGIGKFSSSGRFNTMGNVMSLQDGDNFSNSTSISNDRQFQNLFNGCTNLVNASNLILPATTLAWGCYYSMFQNCSSLTTAPELPATTLTYNNCYTAMFQGCSSLTTAPELPATTLAAVCYHQMFNGCSSLTSAPELPATTLANGCYAGMFANCSSLTSAPELPATTLTATCYQVMFANCTSLTSAPELPATRLNVICYAGMFEGCTSLTTAPELPVTTLCQLCYSNMFNGCSSLTSAPELPATTLEPGCYYHMFEGCTSLTSAPELPATTLAGSCYEEMFNNCSMLNYVKCLATDITATDCTTLWLQNVSTSGTFVKDVNTTWTTGTSGIPVGWTVQNEGTPNEYFYVETTHNTGGYDDYLELELLCSTYSSVNYTRTHQTLYYSYDKTNWYLAPYRDSYISCNIYDKIISGTTYKYAADLMKIPFNNNNIIYLKGNLSPRVTSTAQAGTVQFDAGIIYKLRSCYTASQETPNNFNVGGNICSLLYGDINHNTIPNDYTYVFESMFNYPSSTTSGPVCNIIDASNILMPVNVADYCFYRMFRLCRSLTTAPALPATTLTNCCYYYMFSECTSLTTAPELPATILTQQCYQGMFYRCSSLTTAPELPATTLASQCYYYMFYNCTSLTTPPALPATSLAYACYNGMFNSCTSLTTAPALPATTLTTYCYTNMFRGCTLLNYVKCLATDISATGCLTNWLNNVSATGTFVKDVNTTWPSGNSGIPVGWTIQNA